MKANWQSGKGELKESESNLRDVMNEMLHWTKEKGRSWKGTGRDGVETIDFEN
jgi:hypothetical protein